MSDRRLPLTVDADLDVAVNGHPVAVTTSEDRVFVEFPSVRALARALRRPPTVDYRSMDALLRRADLAVEVRARHRTVLALGADTRPSVLLRRAGIHPVELRLTGVVSALGASLAAGVGRVRAGVRRLRRSLD